MKKGIYVLIQGQESETVPWSTANFGYNEKQMGTLTGEIAAAGVKAKYPNAKDIKLAVLGDPGWASSNIRMGGAKDAFVKGLPGVKVNVVLDGVMGSTIEKATNAIESALQQNPDLRCVVGINDDAAIGAVGRHAGQGYRCRQGGLHRRRGQQQGNLAVHRPRRNPWQRRLEPPGHGRSCPERGRDLVNGKKVPEMMYIDMIKVTKDNLSTSGIRNSPTAGFTAAAVSKWRLADPAEHHDQG